MQKIVPLRKADVSHFTADEIVLVDTIIEAAAGLTGAELSEVSHEFVGWILARDGATIPYETMLVIDESPDEFVIGRTQELVANHGW